MTRRKMIKREGNRVTEDLGSVCPYELEHDLPVVIAHLQTIIDDHPDHHKIWLSWDTSYYDEETGEFTVYGERTETEREKTDRLTADKVAKLKTETRKAMAAATREKRERTILANLKARYEG